MDFAECVAIFSSFMTTALYPGTFDPVTMGHLDVLSRASKLFDRVIVAVSGGNSSKNTTFDVESRVEMVRENLDSFSNATVESFEGLLVDYAKSKQATVLVRGLRAVSDFEYEFQMAQMNGIWIPNWRRFFLPTKSTTQAHN